MTYPNGGASNIWRDGDAGAYNPKKGEIREWGAAVETNITGVEVGLTVAQGDIAGLSARDGTAPNPKEKVAVATTANITLSGEQSLDGVLTSTSRVLVKNQAAPAENGIYVSAAGAWARATDMDADAEVDFANVFVNAGTAHGGQVWQTPVSTITLGTNAMPWVQVDRGLTAAEIKVAYEDNADTNAFTDSARMVTNQLEAFGNNFETIGLPPVTGTGVSTNRTYELRTGATYASNVDEVRLWATTAGTLKIKTFTAPVSGSVTMVSEVEVTAVMGLNTFSGLTGLSVPVGGYLGFFCPTGQAQVAYVTGGGGGYFNQAGDTTGTASLGTENVTFRLSVEFDLTRIAVPEANFSDAVTTKITQGVRSATRLSDLTQADVLALGYAPIEGDAGFSNGRIWAHVKDQAQSLGYLSNVSLWATDTGTVKVKVLSDAIDGTTTVLDEITLEVLSAGLNTFSVSPAVEIPKRALIGIYQVASILTRTTSVTGSPLYFPNGDTAVGASVSIGETQQAGTISAEYTVQFESIEENTIKRKPRLKEVNGVLVDGQSWAEAVSAGPALSLTQPYENLTFGSGPRSGKAGSSSGAVNTSPGVSTSKPLVEDDVSPSAAGNTDVGETPCAGLANEAVTLAALEGSLTPEQFVIFASCPAKGGETIARLSKGAVWYQQLIDHVQAQYDLSVADGKTYAMQSVAWMQGEADAANGVSRDVYKAAMVQLQQQIDSDVKAITGQTEDVIMLSYQTRAFGTIEQRKEIALAQWEAARESNGMIVVAGPVYQLEISAQHLTNVGSQRFGRTLGRAFKQIVVDEVAPDTLNPKSCTAVGTALTMRFDVPTLPLIFDTVEIAALTDMGFHVFDDTGDLTLSSIAIDGSTVTMTVNRTLGANPKIAYATKYGAPSGNLRDSSGRPVTINGTEYGQQHWSPTFELPVVTLE